MQLRNVCLLIAVCMLSWRLFSPSQPPAPVTHPTNCPATASASEAQILIVNQKAGASSSFLPGGGFSCPANDLVRQKGEKLCLLRRYTEAIKLFKEEAKHCPHDIRLQLDLGKAYLATGLYAESISALSDVRSQCRSQQQRATSAVDGAKLPGECEPLGLSVEEFYLDALPAGSCQSIDFEARKVLEQASVARFAESGGKPLQAIEPLYANDRHYMVLTASLALGQRYHKQSKDCECAALFQLATENSLRLPPSVVSNAVARGTASQQWHAFAQLALNAITPEEKTWYYERLQDQCERLQEDNIRIAATYHAVGARSSGARRLWLFNSALALADTAGADNRHFAANCAYDSGLQSFKDGSFTDAQALLQKALTEYQREQSLGEQTQTQYCLGLVDFVRGNSGPAKNHFLQASQWNHLSQDQDQLASEQDDPFMSTFLVKEYASYDAAVLAAEYVPDSADKQFMIAHAAKWEGPEAAAQAGLYFFKLGDDSVAEEYLSKAAQAYFPYDELQVPSLQGATNGTIACKDQEYSDAQILATFFAHKEPPLERITSRYAQYSNLHQVTELHSLTFDFCAGYQYLVRDLYHKILLKRHKLTELALLDFAASKTLRDTNSDKVKPENDVSDYLHTVQNRLVSSWYCPTHNESDQMSLHLRLDEHGNINRVTIAQPAKVSEINQSVLEALRWAAPLPAPPPQWHNRDLIVVFNAEDSTAVEHDLRYTTPQPGFVPRPEYY